MIRCHGGSFAVAHSAVSKSCTYVRNNVNALPWLELCSRYVTTVRIIYSRGGSRKELVVTSAYLPYDSNELPRAKRRISSLTVTAETAAHHCVRCQ